MNKPLLVYDGACEFCRRWVQRWQARTEDRVEYLPLQRPGVLRQLGVSRADALQAVQLVTPEHRRYSGAEAVFRTLEHAPELRVAARAGRLPVVRQTAELLYRRIARHRSFVGRLDRLLFGTSTRPPDRRVVRAWFLRALGGVYLIAFTSLGTQVKGLYGRRGIRPIDDYLRSLHDILPARERLLRIPTLFWIDASDDTLVLTCRAGQLGGVLLMLGIKPRATAAILWLLYLSFVSTGREFLSFQWDALLLENGLHAVVTAPSSRSERPSWVAQALMRWLAFRLQFESGHAKIGSGDPSWRTGTACCVHFETQPLPTRAGWYAHQAPRWLKRAATYTALAIELGVPWLAFAPRRLRGAAFVVLAGLQGLIATTGNYGFFNLLTVVDDLWLLDDSMLARAASARGTRPRWRRRLGIAIAAIPIVAISASVLVARVFRGRRMSRTIRRLHAALAPLHSVNTYGLFAVMTTERPEIVIEGSDDGVAWREYRFRYKPQDVTVPPRLAAPHQPRLDWQMWFAALGPPPPWFGRLLQRLLEGSPDVLALFEHDPFGGRAPKYVRAVRYEYHMTDRVTRRRTGAWWRRERLGTYVPPLELLARQDHGSLAGSEVTS